MINGTSQPEQPDSSKTVSGDPGVVHMRRLLMRKLMVLALLVLLPLF